MLVQVEEASLLLSLHHHSGGVPLAISPESVDGDFDKFRVLVDKLFAKGFVDAVELAGGGIDLSLTYIGRRHLRRSGMLEKLPVLSIVLVGPNSDFDWQWDWQNAILGLIHQLLEARGLRVVDAMVNKAVAMRKERQIYVTIDVAGEVSPAELRSLRQEVTEAGDQLVADMIRLRRLSTWEGLDSVRRQFQAAEAEAEGVLAQAGEAASALKSGADLIDVVGKYVRAGRSLLVGLEMVSQSF